MLADNNIIAIIIIIAEMTVSNVAGYLIGHRGQVRVACNLLFPHEDNIIPNKFIIFLRKAHSDEKTVPVVWLD